MVDQVQDQLNEAVAEAALEALGSGLIDIVADLLTDGAAALLSGPEGEAIAAAAVDRINAVCQILLGALRASAEIQNISIDGDTALSRAIHAMPQPAVAKDSSWQVGDDIMPANSASRSCSITCATGCVRKCWPNLKVQISRRPRPMRRSATSATLRCTQPANIPACTLAANSLLRKPAIT